MNGSAFLLGVLAGVVVRGNIDQRVSDEAARVQENAARRLEDVANAHSVNPIAPEMSVVHRVAAANGRFQFGVPQGFGPLPSPLLERWIATAGPSLATVADAHGEGLPMLITVNDAGLVDPSVERAFWRLSFDLRKEVRQAALQQGLSITDGPDAALVAGARAICYAATGQEDSIEVRNWNSTVINNGSAIDITMNVNPSLETRYLPIWRTVLGTWAWLS